MASEQDSDSQNNPQNAPSGATASNDAQKGNKGSSRTRYSRKAKKDVASVEKVVEDNQDEKKVIKGQAKSTKKKARVEPQVDDRKEVDGVTEHGLSLPSDIWILIAEQAHPVSLLQLTRVNKTLRNLLTSKRASRAIWKKHIDRLNLPQLEHGEERDIAFISFIYEDVCAHCAGPAADKEDWNLLVNWHSQSCESKLFIKANKLPKKLHSEIGKCVAITTKNKQHLQTQITSVNARLTNETDSVKRSRMIKTLKRQVAAIQKDGLALSHWYTESLESRDRNLYDRLGQTYAADDIMAFSALFNLDPVPLTDSEWSNISLAYSEAIDAAVTEREEGERRKSLTQNYQTLKRDLNPNKFEIFPPFSTFLELPTIKSLWVPAVSSHVFWHGSGARYRYCRVSEIQDLPNRWKNALPTIKTEIVKSVRWYKIGYVRILAEALHETAQPLPSSLLSSLNPPDTSTPASWTPLSLATLNYDDPSLIATQVLDEILNRYSMQAWYSEHDQLPGHFSHHLPSEQINEFPRFHPYWRNILLQALEAVDFVDGPVGQTAVRLDALGPHFSCGQCSTLDKDVRLSVLLRHLQTHSLPPSKNLSEQLIIYNDPGDPSGATLQASSSNVSQLATTSTKKRTSKGKK